MPKDRDKARLLEILARHVGEHRAIGMAELFELVYETPVGDRINDTRMLRKLITAMRLEGSPIASTSQANGGAGYYLTAVESELDDYCRRVRSRALAALRLESKIRQVSMERTLNAVQSQLKLEGDLS